MKFCIQTVLILLIFCFTTNVYSQKVGLSTITNNGEALETTARFHWGSPFIYNLHEFNENIKLRGGLIFKKEGLTYELDGDSYNHRVYGVGPELGFVFFIKKKIAAYAAYGVDYYYHYRSVIIPGSNPDNEAIREKHFFPNEVNKFNQYLRFDIGMMNGIALVGEYYLNDLMNKDFLLADGVTRPYEGFEETRFNIGLKFNFYGLMGSKLFNNKDEEDSDEEKEDVQEF